MSLVPTFVQGSDGSFYQNPVLRQGDNWFICFDDEEPPELVVKRNRVAMTLDEASTLLMSLGFDHRHLRRHGCSHRCMGSIEALHKADSFFFDMVAPLPIPKIAGQVVLKHDGKVERGKWGHSCVIYSWVDDDPIKTPNNRAIVVKPPPRKN